MPHPHAFSWKLRHDLSLTVPACCWNDNAVAVEHIRLVNEMGMEEALVPQRC